MTIAAENTFSCTIIHSGESSASSNFVRRISQRSEAEEVTTSRPIYRAFVREKRKRKQVKPRVDWQMFAKRARRAFAEILSDTFTFLSIIPHVCFDSIRFNWNPRLLPDVSTNRVSGNTLLMHVSLKQGFAIFSIGSYFFRIFLLRTRYDS